MKKKMKINMSKLSIGGMEKALVNFICISKLYEKYDITLLLVYKGEKNYTDLLPKEVNLEIIRNGKWNLTGKIVAAIKLSIKLIKTIFKKNKYDISICYTHHHGILSKLTRHESNYSILVNHADLKSSRNDIEIKKLNSKIKFNNFDKILCVSKKGKISLNELFPNTVNKSYVLHNYIDYKNILNLSMEKVEMKKKTEITFLNVGRQEECSKKITRIITSSEKLIKEGYKFNVLLIGEGPDTNMYKELTDTLNLNKVIKFLGKKINPYPYYKLSDALIVSSGFEGYGLVLDEARLLNCPIISTDIADAKFILTEGYGIICENSADGVYEGMKKFLDKGYKTKQKFNAQKFNDNITEKLYKILEGEI